MPSSLQYPLPWKDRNQPLGIQYTIAFLPWKGLTAVINICGQGIVFRDSEIYGLWELVPGLLELLVTVVGFIMLLHTRYEHGKFYISAYIQNILFSTLSWLLPVT